MVTMPVGEFKSRFSEAIEMVRSGEQVVISYGRRHTRVAVLVPYSRLYGRAPRPRKLGALGRLGSFKLAKGYKLTDEELLSS